MGCSEHPSFKNFLEGGGSMPPGPLASACPACRQPPQDQNPERNPTLWSSSNEIYTLVPVCISHLSSVYISLTDDTQYVYLVNLRHRTRLIGVHKSVKSADFFDTVILYHFCFIEQQVSYNCGIEFQFIKSRLILFCKYNN